MHSAHPDRRRFLKETAAGASAFTLGMVPLGCVPQGPPAEPPAPTPPPPPQAELDAEPTGPRPKYTGPNVVIVRFGGGVRRRETVRHDVQSYCPFILHELVGKHGTLF